LGVRPLAVRLLLAGYPISHSDEGILVKPARLAVFVVGLALCVGSSAALAQRIQFGTGVAEPTPAAGQAITGSTGSAPQFSDPRTILAPQGTVGTTGSPYAPGPLDPSMAPPSLLPGGVAPLAPGMGGAGRPPGQSYIAPSPYATLEGTVQPVPFDPYGGGGTQPQSIYGQDPNYGGCFSTAPFATAQKFLHEIRFDYHFLTNGGDQPFGTNDIELTSTFAVPLLARLKDPLLITPGFAVHYWNGPDVSPAASPATADLPPYVFDTYLDLAWNPKIHGALGAELGFRVGVFSDFGKIDHNSIRYMGHGVAVISLFPKMQLKLGMVYLDRNRIKLLPVIGVVLSPDSNDVEFELVFPYPKIAKRFAIVGDAEWWWYLRGEYGGGKWAVERAGGFRDSVDYNDLRVALGLEFRRPMKRLNALVEIGLAFDREIVYAQSATPTYFPSNTMFLRAGFWY